MAVFVTNDYQIAVGINNAGGLALITSITDADGVAFISPTAWSTWRRGERRIRANGTSTFAGFPSITWSFSYVTAKQMVLLRASYEGLVTVRATLNGTTFANYNAVLQIDDNGELTPTVFSVGGYSGIGFREVVLTFTRLVAL